MQRFLEACAAYIYRKHSGQLTELCLVFPNRRAGVFFSAYLKKQLDHPAIAPQMITINELVHGFSGLQPADRLMLISVLYEIYRKHTSTAETFDDFYFWGEVLLSDFDDLDKYRADAGSLFRNISELKEIERLFDFLSPEQRALLEQFWGSLRTAGESPHQREFVSVWSKLAAIYADFRTELEKRGIAYSGLLYRDGIEKLLQSDPEKLPFRKYYFIGMNALNACEKELFGFLQKSGRAGFFWDFDNFYLDNLKNSAGKFLRENLQLFPPPEDFTIETDHFSRPKNIELVAVASATGQAQVAPRFLHELGERYSGRFDNTAVVLADESLLFPVLGALPENIGSVNVTMGYPVKNSPVVSLVNLMASLLRNTKTEPGKPVKIWHRLATDLLNHQLLTGAEPEKTAQLISEVNRSNRIYLSPGELGFSPLHQAVFTLPAEVSGYAGYFLGVLRQVYQLNSEKEENPVLQEMIYTVYTAFEKLEQTIRLAVESDRITISAPVFFRLMRQYLNQVSVPFEGEPLSGLQVMGILETRCLDFENLIIIGLNEEVWPRTFSAPSFIPYHVRKAFGLPTIDEQDAMYAYYFYRLIQRASHLTATWSTESEGVTTGELSRFGYQLLLKSPHQVRKSIFEFPFFSAAEVPVTGSGSPEITEKLLAFNSAEKPLSPSAINTYLHCRLKFYFRYLTGLKEPDQVQEEVDRQAFGNIFHKAVENLYRPFLGSRVSAGQLADLQKNKTAIQRAVRNAFATEYFFVPEEKAGQTELDGKTILIFSTIETYLDRLLEIDRHTAPFVLHAMESAYSLKQPVLIDGRPQEVWIGGKIDRIDEVEGVVRVIDYKTGNVDAVAFASVEELFDRERTKMKKEITQALIYSLILKRGAFAGSPVSPAIYRLLNFHDENFQPVISYKKQPLEISMVDKELEEQLATLIGAIFSPAASFDQTPIKDRCSYCPYATICMRS